MFVYVHARVCVCVCVCVCVQGHSATKDLLTGEDLSALRGMVECEPPNRHLYDFVGNIQLQGQRSGILWVSICVRCVLSAVCLQDKKC